MREHLNKSGFRVAKENTRRVLAEMPLLSGEPSGEAPHPWHDQTPGIRGLAFDESKMFGQKPPRLPQLWGSWYHSLRQVGEVFRKLLGGYGTLVAQGVGFGQEEQRSGVFSRELPLDHSKAKLPKHEEKQGSLLGVGRSRQKWSEENYSLLPTQSRGAPGGGLPGACKRRKKVYDLLNCGPRSRFVVRSSTGKVLLSHNCTQGTARDVFAEGILNLERHGVPVLWHVHDEVICEVDPDFPKEEAESLLSVPPPWMADLPIAAEAVESPYYCK